MADIDFDLVSNDDARSAWRRVAEAAEHAAAASQRFEQTMQRLSDACQSDEE